MANTPPLPTDDVKVLLTKYLNPSNERESVLGGIYIAQLERIDALEKLNEQIFAAAKSMGREVAEHRKTIAALTAALGSAGSAPDAGTTAAGDGATAGAAASANAGGGGGSGDEASEDDAEREYARAQAAARWASKGGGGNTTAAAPPSPPSNGGGSGGGGGGFPQGPAEQVATFTPAGQAPPVGPMAMTATPPPPMPSKAGARGNRATPNGTA